MESDKTCVLALDESRRDVGRPSAYLVVVAGGAVGRTYKLAAQETLLGRERAADVVLGNPGVSRRHAAIRRLREGSLELIDLGSTNGTWVNGARVERHLLRDGDRIRLGCETVFRFSLHDELEEAFQQQLYDAATRDPLTHLYNKRYFLERLEEELGWAQRHRLPLSLLLCDVDHFKQLNDTFGHLAGDAVLVQLACRIEQGLRAGNLCCRFGGEEFAMLVRGGGPERAIWAAERVRRLVAAAPFEYQGLRIPITVSVGIATSHGDDGHDVRSLIARADRYLYEAKRAGRNRVGAEAIVA